HPEVETPLLVELERGGELALVGPGRHLPGPLDELAELGRQPARQRLAVLGPLPQFLVDVGDDAGVEQRGDQLVGLGVPDALRVRARSVAGHRAPWATPSTVRTRWRGPPWSAPRRGRAPRPSPARCACWGFPCLLLLGVEEHLLIR